MAACGQRARSGHFENGQQTGERTDKKGKVYKVTMIKAKKQAAPSSVRPRSCAGRP